MAALTITNTFTAGTQAVASEVNQNFNDVKNFANSQVVHRDGTGFMTAVTAVGGTQALAGVPAGIIAPFAGSIAPSGWLLCQGQNVSRSTYAALFAVLGITYGAGDGVNTFTLPDLRGRVPVGLDSGQTEFDALGETGGAKTHTLTVAQMPAHTHTQNAHNHSASSGSAGSHSHTVFGTQTNAGGSNGVGVGDLVAGNVGYNYSTSTEGSHSHSVSVSNATAVNQNTGGGSAHNNLQPYLTIVFVIKH